jgi:hypothetical protein
VDCNAEIVTGWLGPNVSIIRLAGEGFEILNLKFEIIWNLRLNGRSAA